MERVQTQETTQMDAFLKIMTKVKDLDETVSDWSQEFIFWDLCWVIEKTNDRKYSVYWITKDWVEYAALNSPKDVMSDMLWHMMTMDVSLAEKEINKYDIVMEEIRESINNILDRHNMYL